MTMDNRDIVFLFLLMAAILIVLFFGIIALAVVFDGEIAALRVDVDRLLEAQQVMIGEPKDL